MEPERQGHDSAKRRERVDRDETIQEPAEGGGFDRRMAVLGLGAGAALAVAACSSAGGEPGDGVADETEWNGFPWLEADIDTLQAAKADGRTSAVALTEAYLARIEQIDGSGPTLRSVIEVNPDALEIAESLDRERAEGSVRGPLHGMPILLKDNIATADRMTTTAGSLALEGSIPPQDSFVAARLRQAGAVLLGKANLSEWANFRSSNSSSGWSARGGQCKNPYALNRNPCGSSSGSGAATSANLCVAAIGTETNGSIVCPSSANGIVGIKPSLGLVSRSGIVPIAHSQDTAGPMARTLRDAVYVLDALVGSDDEDAITSAASDYVSVLESLRPEAAAGKRLGVLRSSMGFDRRVDALVEAAVEALVSLGAEVVDIRDEGGREMGRAAFKVLLCEQKSDLALYLGGLGDAAPVKTLADVIAFNKEHADREMPFFGQELFEQAEATGGVNDPEYAEALATSKRLAREEGVDRLLSEQRLDAIIAPTGGPAWVTDLVNGDHFSGGSSSLAAIAGYPNVTVPMGFIHGLPVGLSFFGAAFQEARVLSIAYAYEQATRHRRSPEFAASAVET